MESKIPYKQKYFLTFFLRRAIENIVKFLVDKSIIENEWLDPTYRKMSGFGLKKSLQKSPNFTFIYYYKSIGIVRLLYYFFRKF
jgi:hypothetical protein